MGSIRARFLSMQPALPGHGVDPAYPLEWVATRTCWRSSPERGRVSTAHMPFSFLTAANPPLRQRPFVAHKEGDPDWNTIFIMPLMSFWKTAKEDVLKLRVDVIVKMAGDGNLRDQSPCAVELRQYL